MIDVFDFWLVVRKDENELGAFSAWNITGTYRGAWKFLQSSNISSRFPNIKKSSGNSVLELVSRPTKINGVHYVQGVMIFHDVFDNEPEAGRVHIRVEGVYIWPFRQLRMVANSGREGDFGQEDDYILSNPYHLSLFNAFATAAFFKFVVFSIFEMRYLLAIWKAGRSMNSGEGWEAMRRELSVLYSRFYGILLGGILFMYEFHRYLRPILLLLHSFWIPQIITNIVRDSRKPLHPQYIIGMSLTRLAIPLYVFGCPHNFMRIEPDNKWCISLCALVGFQAAILILQHYLGSRCFIPHQILPEKYCYFRKVDPDSNNASDCVICMTAIDHTQHSVDCMVTPCDHFFHSGCLQRWMDIKMECPTCRRSLPPA
ncbi:hypothetical protein CTI12_AA050190 [Artemisia annua]|uniref:RING-type E3 ubiquitin transferase n=1 Tax=Artemisia annua TaxID=35608 RepID=A0A2U1Q0F9_ARTAN|nr:hypothetical protein CTI12_AA050190 [Artemisia annua]